MKKSKIVHTSQNAKFWNLGPFAIKKVHKYEKYTKNVRELNEK